jgi:dihydroorotate dehydrogenase (fumarate)
MNLATSHLGLPLDSPFVVGASPFCDYLETALRLQDAGASAIVMRSLFVEQLAPTRPSNGSKATSAFGRSQYSEYTLSPDGYLRHVEYLKGSLSIPVIASLNGHDSDAWSDFARRLENAGADAIELNFYQVVTDPAIPADQVELEMITTVGRISGSVQIPVAAKISPFHASVAQLVVALELAGAAGTVLFNRFYQPDVDIDEVKVVPVLRLSNPQELLLRLRWLAILSPLVSGSLSATGGIHTSEDVVKALLTGAHSVQLVSVLLTHGPGIIATLREGLETWMREHGYDRLDQFRGGLNHKHCPDGAAFERANYINVLQSWSA